MFGSCPSLRCSYRTKSVMQRSKAFGHAVVVSKTCYKLQHSVFGKTIAKIELLATVFQLTMFAKCEALPKGDLFDMFVSGVHSCHSFWKCNASTPYQKLKVAESGSTLCQLCNMLASCPSLCCSCKKKHLSHAEKQSVWSRSCGLQDLLQCCDCALSCAMRLLQTNEPLSRFCF